MGSPSKYQLALRSIGTVLHNYDTDKKHAFWGFGLALNGANIIYPEYKDVDGIIGLEKSYVNTVQQMITNKVSSIEPTALLPTILKAKNIAINEHKHKELKYSLLLILTDGKINDISSVVDEVVNISNMHLPISIIIVGIGNHDFRDMRMLDACKNPLVSSFGYHAQRDIVQFVDINNCKPTDALKEIPIQFGSYVNKYQLKPGKLKEIRENSDNYHINNPQFMIADEEGNGNTVVNEVRESLEKIDLGNVNNPYYGGNEMDVKENRGIQKAPYIQHQHQMQQPIQMQPQHGQQPGYRQPGSIQGQPQPGQHQIQRPRPMPGQPQHGSQSEYRQPIPQAIPQQRYPQQQMRVQSNTKHYVMGRYNPAKDPYANVPLPRGWTKLYGI